MGFKKYLEATTKAEKERMIKAGQSGLSKYKDFISYENNSKKKLSEDILSRLPKFWINSIFKDKQIIYEEDFINFCKDKISVNKPINDFYFRAIFINGGNAYFTNADNILHFILVVYLILIGVLPHTEEILNWHKQNDSISNEIMNKFIALDLFDEGNQYTVKLSGSYSSSSKRKLKQFISNHSGYEKALSKYKINNKNIIL